MKSGRHDTTRKGRAGGRKHHHALRGEGPEGGGQGGCCSGEHLPQARVASGPGHVRVPPPVAVPPTTPGDGALAHGAPARTTMPMCLVHATPRVRHYFLAVAEVETALDIAGWWVQEREAEDFAQRIGWDRADLQSAVLVWLEARRPEVRSRPDVSVPGVPLPTPVSVARAASAGRDAPSLEALSPTESSPHPDISRFRDAYRDFFFQVADAGLLWDPFSPHTQFDLLARSALRLEPKGLGSNLSAWGCWQTWWTKGPRRQGYGTIFTPSHLALARFFDHELLR